MICERSLLRIKKQVVWAVTQKLLQEGMRMVLPAAAFCRYVSGGTDRGYQEMKIPVIANNPITMTTIPPTFSERALFSVTLSRLYFHPRRKKR